MYYFQYGLCSLFTVRALILDLRSEPDSPIPGSDNNAGCLLAGSEVKIVCENIAFPVGTVVFEKDSTEIVADERCVPHVCSNVQSSSICTCMTCIPLGV